MESVCCGPFDWDQRTVVIKNRRRTISSSRRGRRTAWPDEVPERRVPTQSPRCEAWAVTAEVCVVPRWSVGGVGTLKRTASLLLSFRRCCFGFAMSFTAQIGRCGSPCASSQLESPPLIDGEQHSIIMTVGACSDLRLLTARITTITPLSLSLSHINNNSKLNIWFCIGIDE